WWPVCCSSCAPGPCAGTVSGRSTGATSWATRATTASTTEPPPRAARPPLSGGPQPHPGVPMSTTLVLGAARSGKSRHARSLPPADARVTLVIPTRPHEDDPTAPVPGAVEPPPGWQTIETQELSRVLMAARGPVLLDTLDTWVDGVLDQTEGWEVPGRSAKRITEPVGGLHVE